MEGRIIGFIPFPRVLVLCEMQSVSSRIWTRIVVSNSYDDNHYTTGTLHKKHGLLLWRPRKWRKCPTMYWYLTTLSSYASWIFSTCWINDQPGWLSCNFSNKNGYHLLKYGSYHIIVCVMFYGISTLVDYLMLNPVYIHILLYSQIVA